MEKLKVTSKRLQIAVFILMLLVPCIVVFGAITGSWAELLHTPRGISLDTTQISGISLLVMLILGSIKPVVYIIAFWFLYKLLGLYHDGLIFTTETVAAVRRIGWVVASIDIADMLLKVITGPILSFYDISSGYIVVNLEVNNLIIGLFIVVTAYVMNMGRELKEQDDLVI